MRKRNVKRTCPCLYQLDGSCQNDSHTAVGGEHASPGRAPANLGPEHRDAPHCRRNAGAGAGAQGAGSQAPGGGGSHPGARSGASEPRSSGLDQGPRPCARDAHTRQVQDAVTNVEKHFRELCQIFAACVRKTARTRDKADLLVNEINVEGLEAKVVERLKAYGTIVKMKRDDLKAALTARNREAKQLTQKEHVSETHRIDMLLILNNFKKKKKK
ncbi:hypothetical protein GH733_008916 [Mirounga leonina]|nr:hypothetical protein GH733_008916 [Mirounga leonina]